MDYVHKFLVSPVRAWSETLMMGKKTCPDKDSSDVKDFNLPKLLGDWFILFRSYSAFEESGHCAMKRITRETDPDEWYKMKTQTQTIDRSKMEWAERESKIGAMRPLPNTYTEFKYKFVIDQPWWEPLDVIYEDGNWIIVTSC